MAPRVAVLVFPGSNDHHDAVRALRLLDAEPVLVWHGDGELPDVQAVILPGGFSYGDYLRCGAIARFSPAMRAVTRFANEGGLVLGICNGFQILAEAGLLPGVLRPNASLEFVCADVPLIVGRTDLPFTARCEPGQRVTIPIKCGEGAWYGEVPEEQIVLRYADGNPTGSAHRLAGVCNEDRNVMGLMPHPEHAVDLLLGTGDGSLILGSLVDAARERLPVPA
jgi:phosphoribosylformylglycinamidine synthase subunit PurQ / glutaminase